MNKKTKRAYHHGDLKATLIDAALKLVRKKGPRGFTLNEASRSAGVSVSAPYNHFRDKDELLIEIVLLGNRTLLDEIGQAADMHETDKEKLIAVYMGYIEFARKHPDLFSVMFQSGVDKRNYPAVRAAAEEAFGFGLDIASRLENCPEKATELALAVWTMAHGFAMLSAEHALDQVTSSKTSKSALGLAHRLIE